MPKSTGAWSKDETVGQHVFSLNLARWIGNFLPKEQPLVDMGCGFGDYLWLWGQMGFQNLMGVEGSDLGELFQFKRITVHDLTEPIGIIEKGNVVALEIGEHIPAQFQELFIQNITFNVAGGCHLVLSWAIPGQGGHGHVNCLPNETVISEIEKHGFKFLPRESISARDVTEHNVSWFRNTIMIFKKHVEEA